MIIGIKRFSLPVSISDSPSHYALHLRSAPLTFSLQAYSGLRSASLPFAASLRLQINHLYLFHPPVPFRPQISPPFFQPPSVLILAPSSLTLSVFRHLRSQISSHYLFKLLAPSDLTTSITH